MPEEAKKEAGFVPGAPARCREGRSYVQLSTERAANRRRPSRHVDCISADMDTVVLDFHGTHRLLGERLYLQGASFCFKDLSLAASSLAEAETSVDLADREGHLERARQSVDRVLRALPRLALNEDDFESVCAVIDRLHARLAHASSIRVRPS
jgi:hypothetical protein